MLTLFLRIFYFFHWLFMHDLIFVSIKFLKIHIEYWSKIDFTCLLCGFMKFIETNYIFIVTGSNFLRTFKDLNY